MKKEPNPYRPGAGHPPPHLSGRDIEHRDFLALLDQEPVLRNLVLTGLRGVGKTVLLEAMQPLAAKRGWLWAGTDLSESASMTEQNMAIRLMADLAPLVTGVEVTEREVKLVGYKPAPRKVPVTLSYAFLEHVYNTTPGLVADKLKAVLELVWKALAPHKLKGIVLAYDEAQNLSDQSADRQFPLSLLLEIFQSLQKKGYPYLLVLTGLPTLYPKLLSSRTFAERMFRIMVLDKLPQAATREAIEKPIRRLQPSERFSEITVKDIIRGSDGYPYFIQFICREAFDSHVQQRIRKTRKPTVDVSQIVRKLDNDFYAGRWNKLTDRQRDLLTVMAYLKDDDGEYTVQQIVAFASKKLSKGFSASHVTQMLATLGEQGVVYKNRHGRYSFAIPLLNDFIKRLNAQQSKG